MDDLLPSYESVIRQNPWELVAPYLLSDDLCSASLVCQKWHEIFTPQLWGNPASHFGVQNDTVYVALTRFKRTLFWSRLSVRELTHTLHLPPAHAEIYGGPHAEWLRDCLERLPRLQSLIVDGLPFFDHASLLTLRHSSQWWKSTHPNAYPVFGLRLLDASGCKNTTSTGLTEALPHFPDLVSLDLSRTYAAKDENVLDRLRYLRNLRVLRLRKLGLKDSDLEIVAKSITTRVRSLDVSENNLTDGAARLLLDHCIKETPQMSRTTRTPLLPFNDGAAGEMAIFGTENLDNHLRKKLTGGFVGSLAIEQASDVGITHLYISRNSVTVEGVSGLLRSRRLQVLDIGTLPLVMQHPTNEEEKEVIILPGVEKLTPIIADGTADKLTYLRLHYSIITKDAPSEPLSSPRAELDAGLSQPVTNDAIELEATEQPLPELDTQDNGVYELPAGSMEPVELSAEPASHGTNATAANAPPTIEVIPEPTLVKRGPAYAPEPVIQARDPTLVHRGPAFAAEHDTQAHGTRPVSPLVGARDAGALSPMSPMTPFPDLVANSPVVSEPASPGLQPLQTRSRHNSSYFVEDRRARLDMRHTQEKRLHPGMISNVHTLVLTDVPTSTEDRQVIHRLIQFIKDAAEESAIAKLRAHHTYILPPGRSRKLAEQEYVKNVFALRRIVFEMAPPPVAVKKISTSWREYPTISSTEDADSEAFWQAATHDFSFFGDEECGLPNAEPGRHLPLAAMDGLMLASPRRHPAPDPKPRLVEAPAKPVLDVVGEIGKFRREMKGMYQARLAWGESDPDVEGHWPGDITVVRKPAVRDEGEEDYYGNRYEGGWLYR